MQNMFYVALPYAKIDTFFAVLSRNNIVLLDNYT